MIAAFFIRLKHPYNVHFFNSLAVNAPGTSYISMQSNTVLGDMYSSNVVVMGKGSRISSRNAEVVITEITKSIGVY